MAAFDGMERTAARWVACKGIVDTADVVAGMDAAVHMDTRQVVSSHRNRRAAVERLDIVDGNLWKSFDCHCLYLRMLRIGWPDIYD